MQLEATSQDHRDAETRPSGSFSGTASAILSGKNTHASADDVPSVGNHHMRCVGPGARDLRSKAPTGNPVVPTQGRPARPATMDVIAAHEGRHVIHRREVPGARRVARPPLVPPWWVLPSLPVEVGARRRATRVRTIWTKEVERALNYCQGPVPPVGVEPTRTTLLGSLPLPVGLRGRPQSYRDSANSGPQTK